MSYGILLSATGQPEILEKFIMAFDFRRDEYLYTESRLPYVDRIPD